MRILHIVGRLNRGGAETWLLQVLQHIDRSKYQFDFLVHSAEPGAYDDEVIALGARVIPCLSPSHPMRYGINFLKILRDFGPYDCVHSHVHHFSGYTMFLARLAGIKMRIAHSHTAHLESSAPMMRRAYLAAMKQLVDRFATCGIAVNDEAGASLFSGEWKEDSRRRLCPIGIDLSKFDVKPDRQAWRKRLGIAEDAIVVGHVGRFVEAKNHSFFVKVAKVLSDGEPRARFLLVGDGPLRPEIEDLASRYGIKERFVFTGNSGDVPALLNTMDVFLFPSVYEGMPLALLEAQAAGLPCLVSTNVPVGACVVGQLIDREELSTGPEAWADVALSLMTEQEIVSVLPGLQNYSVEESVRILSGVYCAASPTLN